MSRLTRIRIEGFRSLRSVDLELGPVTVLIGANGSGKSNLLSALRMVSMMRTGSLRAFVAESGFAASLLHYGPARTPELGLSLDFAQEQGTNTYAVRLAYTADDHFAFREEAIGWQAEGQEPLPPFQLGSYHTESRLDDAQIGPAAKTAKAVSYCLRGLTFFHFHDTSMTSHLRRAARKDDNRFLRSNGSNLPAFLHRLMTSEDEGEQKAWRRINRLIQRAAPAIKSLVPSAVGDSVRLNWIDDQDAEFGVHQLSDGTLRAIALITALSQPSELLPRFMSIDEPELGLHPAVLGLLAGLIRSVSARCQVLVATQSPALLDHFCPEEVVVTERGAGETTFHHLDPAALATWLERYTLSELFDKNVLGGRP